MKFIKFIERDVDGCGTDATVLIVADTNDAIDAIELNRIIKDLKEQLQEYDTDEIVYIACEKYFGKRNVLYKTVYYTEIEF